MTDPVRQTYDTVHGVYNIRYSTAHSASSLPLFQQRNDASSLHDEESAPADDMQPCLAPASARTKQRLG